MQKSPEAFRTISEVADWLGVPTHVLRFWESRFSQVKPVKRAGGRRYYRPNDMMLLGGIKRLLHDDGMTIRGVQKLLREEGVKHVAGFSQPLDAGPMIDVTPVEEPTPMAVDVEPEPVENVVPLKPDPVEEPPAEEEDAPEPELSFLRRVTEAEETGSAKPVPPSPSADPDQPSLFTSSRRSPPEPETTPEPAPAAAIPETPHVPASDPVDDDPAYAAGPGTVVRLRASLAAGKAPDRATLEETVTRLRTLREALAS